jgi:ATP-dependent Clp protease ATP-binding subunit ClpA
MFERYNEAARRALFFARYESSQLGAVSIETHHLLLGLIRDARVAALLAPLPLERLRQELESRSVFREKLPTSVEIPIDAATQRSLQFAVEEADLLLHSFIGTEHLLLGLLREETSVAAAALAAHGVSLGEVRKKVQELPGRPEMSLDVATGVAIDQIRALVDELARTPRDSAEAMALVTRIHASLDALLNDSGIR